jgi:hypothetical protein
MELTVTAKYKATKKHPDARYIKNFSEVLTYSDIYTFDDCYDDLESNISYAVRDILLVVSGGYTVSRDYFKSLKIKVNGNLVLNWN